MKSLPTILVVGAMTAAVAAYMAVPLENPISTATAAIMPRSLPAWMSDDDRDLLSHTLKLSPAVIPVQKVSHVVDADTFDVVAVRMKDWTYPVRIRVRNINAPESRSPKCTRERDLARQATEHVKSVLSAPDAVIAITNREKFDKEGRYLAQISVNGKDLGEMLMEHDPPLARRWTDQFEGQTKNFWCAPAQQRGQ